MASLPFSASSPSLALDSPSPVVELSLMNADDLAKPFELSEADILRVEEVKFAQNPMCLKGDLESGMLLIEVRKILVESLVMKYQAGI